MTEPVSIALPGGAQLRGALATPSETGRFPGVVVLHEMTGLNDDIRRITDRFAANGYVAMAPDLFSHGNKLLCLSRVIVSGNNSDAMRRTLADIEAARAFLAARPDVDESRMAVVGFCMGGGFALLVGAKGGFRASAVNYGSVPKDKDALRETCPVVASYGRDDRMFAPQGERLDKHLSELGVAHDVKIYEGVAHSFLNHHDLPAWIARLPSPLKTGYSEPQAEDAWTRMLSFFDDHVRNP